ncbi:MAG: hypothetical protein IT518_18150 [Burkholderiales bacterium]|nr:hypothetical protein [Burkholderiales bacterium]
MTPNATEGDGVRTAMHRRLARVEREFQRQWDAIAPGGEVNGGARGVRRA